VWPKIRWSLGCRQLGRASGGRLEDGRQRVYDGMRRGGGESALAWSNGWSPGFVASWPGGSMSQGGGSHA